MKIIVIHAKPPAKAKEYIKYEGAYFSCWIDYADVYGAFALAKYHVVDSNWKIISVDKSYKDISSMKDLTKEEKEYFREAKKFGYSLVAHLYPRKDR